MEEFAIIGLIFIIIFLFSINSSINSKFETLNTKINFLNKSIESLKKTEVVWKPEDVVLKSEFKSVTDVPKVIPIAEEIKPIILDVVPIPEEIKTIVEEIKPIVAETEKPVLSRNLETPVVEFKKPERKPYVPEKSFWEKFKENNPDLEKFIGENLINKIGILILVLGISYFVSYSIDKGWIPTPARVGIGILAGAMVLGVAHKLRLKYAAFSSVFVAGAIAIFYFTIGIAFHEYKLFGQTVAFAIMVLITAFAALITVSYNRIELAILTLIGGFAVPFMVSTGEGNYMVLFSYILILNSGILAIAYFKKWNLMNVLAFVFTTLLYLGWWSSEIDKEHPHYSGALLFAFAFYLMFTIINIINNIKTQGVFSKMQLAILTVNTFVFYGVGMSILNGFHPEFKGLFTTSVAVLNLVYAWFLYKKFGIDKTAVYVLIGLTLTFVTLAIPIQFAGHYITLFWAGEAVLLIWLSQKSQITSYRFGAVIVHFLMLGSLIMDWQHFYAGDSVLQIVINPIFITGIVGVTSFFGVYYLLRKETKSIFQFGITFNPESYRKFDFVVGIILLYFVGFLEVCYQADSLLIIPQSTTFPVVYHLIFTAILSFFLMKRNADFGYQAVTLIAIVNIVLFAFAFSHFSFAEHEKYISSGIYDRMAFYMHYLMLAIIIYFCYQLYKMYREKEIATFFTKPIFVWIAAFFLIYMASTEVMLHGLILNDSPVTVQEVLKENPTYKMDKYAIESSKSYLASSRIENTRETILKTSFPVLWGILAFVFLIIGIKKLSKALRIIALTLLGLTIAKLFLYDISNVSETGKIIAFILLGVLILIISFVYQKIKVLVSDDIKPEISNTTTKSDEEIN
jgi:Predicted membrane protein (DUF2339)